MSTYYVIPTIGKFKVTITKEFDFYNKSKINHYILNIGGNYDKCVNITIHPEDSLKSKELILSWTEIIDKQCTVNSQIIKGQKTIEMINLAITIARDIAPYAEYVKFNDMSFFYCDTPEGKKKVSLPPYHIAFYDKTWYEDKFKATLFNINDYEKYKTCIKGLYKESIKPTYFNFGNPRITELLKSLYIEAKTWKEFFNLIKKVYPNDKCTLMYPWIESAISLIFKENECGDLYIGKEWKIELHNIPIIHYYQIKNESKIGGGIDNKYMKQYDNYRFVNYNDTYAWDIDSFLKKNRRKYTPKRFRLNKTKKNIELF